MQGATVKRFGVVPSNEGGGEGSPCLLVNAGRILALSMPASSTVTCSLCGTSRVLRQVPRLAPVAHVGAEVLRRIRSRNLMRRRRERLAFGRVLPLSSHRAFCFVMHGKGPK